MSTDNELIRFAIEGDDRAFEDVCVQILPRLLEQQRSRCRRFGLPTDHAEDIVQEAFRRAIPQFRRNRSMEFPEHYLSRTLLNVTKDFLRKRRASRTQEYPADITAPPHDPISAIAVREAFDRLEGHEQEILRRVLLEGETPPEAAAKLGIGKWSAYKRFERALQRLRELLE